MIMYKRFIPSVWFILGVALCGVLLSGCGSKQEPLPPTIIHAKIMTSTSVNPDSNNRPSPIILRIYELTALGNFESADFFSLFKDDTTQLGAELIHREEYQLKPGEQKLYISNPTKETRYIAVLAGYRQLNQAFWKTSIPITHFQTTELSIFLDSLAISIQDGDNK